MPEEEKAHGSVSMATYYRYFLAGGTHIFLFFVTIIFIIGEVRDLIGQSMYDVIMHMRYFLRLALPSEGQCCSVRLVAVGLVSLHSYPALPQVLGYYVQLFIVVAKSFQNCIIWKVF